MNISDVVRNQHECQPLSGSTSWDAPGMSSSRAPARGPPSRGENHLVPLQRLGGEIRGVQTVSDTTVGATTSMIPTPPESHERTTREGAAR